MGLPGPESMARSRERAHADRPHYARDIRAYLATCDKPKTARQIAEAMGIDYKRVYSALQQMVGRDGGVRQLGNGYGQHVYAAWGWKDPAELERQKAAEGKGEFAIAGPKLIRGYLWGGGKLL